MSEHNELFASLGVDRERHDQLISSLAEGHERMHLSQHNRPAAMVAFDGAFHESHGGRVAEIKEFKDKGGHAIGTFCIYIPDEIALAAGVLPVPLCGGSNWSVEYADEILPRDICPLIRSTFGMAMSETCPYGELMDLEVGETTCDAKKKVWDLFEFEVMELPQKKNERDLELWIDETYDFKRMMEKLSGKEITEDALAESIRLCNEKRRVLQKINEFRRLPSSPISGLDCLLISQVALNQDVVQFIGAGRTLIEELEDRVSKGICAYESDGPRILLAGSPSPMGYAKIHHVAESSGLQIVVDETCTGARYYRDLVDESASGIDNMMRAIASRYFAIDCSCFSPNTERMENVLQYVKEYKVAGVLQSILMYCHCYNVEAHRLKEVLDGEGIPSLKIVTDYSDQDTEQLRVRVQAFAEMLSGS